MLGSAARGLQSLSHTVAVSGRVAAATLPRKMTTKAPTRLRAVVFVSDLPL